MVQYYIALAQCRRVSKGTEDRRGEVLDSLYMFRSLVDYKFVGKDRVKKQNELLMDIGIDIDFSNAISNGIRNKCRELGMNGWVISPFW